MISPPIEPPQRRLRQKALDLVFPPRCVGCGRPGHWICPRCWPHLPWLPDGYCIHCSRPVSTGRLCALCLRSASTMSTSLPVNPYGLLRHDGIARKAVHELKYTPHTDIATVLGPMIASRLPALMDAVVVPVPLHWTRKRQRGFNQSELLGRRLAKARGWTVRGDGLIRHRRTKDQVGLDWDQRRSNVAGAFRWDGGRIEKPILLVDDVYTTGSTLNACAAALRASGATVVHAAVFACAAFGDSTEVGPTRDGDEA